MPISPSVCLSFCAYHLSSDGSSYVWNASSPRNLEIMSPDDWCSLKLLLPSSSCETGEGHLYVSRLYQLSLYPSLCDCCTCSQTFIKPSFVFYLPPPSLPFSPTFHQPPSHSLRASWRQWLRTSEDSSAETPASPIPTWKRPSLTAGSLLEV